MNILVIFLTVAILLMGGVYSGPVESTDMGVSIGETPTTEATTTTTTIPTTTTTLAPEVDREWEDLVLAGPTVVNYLHLFMVFASRRDEILSPPIEPPLKYIHDYSLRSILLKISLSMQEAFRLGRDDLIRVRDSMHQIPDHLKAGLLVIKEAPDNLLSQLLPYTLRNVDRAANEASVVSKPTLERFISTKFVIDELHALLNSSFFTHGYTDFLMEAINHCNDIKTQWNLLIKLFRKFSDRADTTQRSINETFIDPINEAQKSNNFSTPSKRLDRLHDLIPPAIFIDQSSYLLNIMTKTYTDIENDYHLNQVTVTAPFIQLSSESERIYTQRQLWQNIVSQSVKIARLAQERQNHFVETGPTRHVEYGTYLQNAIAP